MLFSDRPIFMRPSSTRIDLTSAGTVVWPLAVSRDSAVSLFMPFTFLRISRCPPAARRIDRVTVDFQIPD
jgi:hypothetical protein